MQLFEHTISWFAWAEALLAVMLLVINALYPHTLTQSIQVLSSPIQRRYVEGENQLGLKLIRALFNLCTVALTWTVVAAEWGGAYRVTIGKYLSAIGIVGAVVVVKGGLDIWIQQTFQPSINARTYYAFRSELWLIMCVGLLCVMVLLPWLNIGEKWILPLVVMGSYMLVLWWKLLQAFGWSLTHVGYTLLYMIHVEIVPMLVMAKGIGLVVQ